MEMKDIKNKIVTCYGGSHAYGTNTATSDVDIRGIFCADEISIRTPFFPVREVNIEDQEDGKMYELTNFMKLYCDMNPNILELLWVDESDILETSEAYKLLRYYAPQMLSKKVAFTFTGYALQQMKRIKGHNKWINNPQKVEPPVRVDYVKLQHNFSDNKLQARQFNLRDYNYGYLLVPYGNDIYGLIVADQNCNTYNKDGSIKKFDYDFFTDEQKKQQPLMIVKLCEEDYKRDKEVHSNYWTWKKNRNETRSELEEKYGFDTKHATHAVRLIRMGEEILTEGIVRVKRPDAKELLAIRNGEWTYEQLLDFAEGKDKLIRETLYKTSRLPKTVDQKLAAKVLMEVQDLCWNK